MDTKNIARELAEIPSGYLPGELFNQVARLGVLTAYELVALRQHEGETQVLLTQRDPGDLFWPNMYHNPGTVLRPSDEPQSFVDAVNRLLVTEYSIKDIKDGPFFTGFYYVNFERGKALGIVSWFELDESPTGEYFSIDNLPESLVPEQKPYLIKCAKEFAQYKAGAYTPKLTEDFIIR